MADLVEQDFEEPCPAIRAGLKPMKGLPCLKVSILYQIMSFSPVPHQVHRRAIKVLQMRHGGGFKFARFNFSTQEQGFSCRPEKASYKRTSRNSALLFPNPHRLEEKPAQPKEMSAGCELLVLTVDPECRAWCCRRKRCVGS